jgi:hypothetical protein
LNLRMKLFLQFPRACRLPAALGLMALLTNLACQHSTTSRIRIELHDLPSDKVAASTKPVQPPATCPPAGITPLQSGVPGTGHHKVTLTWNPSASSTDPNSTVTGYCLYRSKVKHAAKKDPLCKDCERINSVPVPTPGCVDDLVSDGTLYYYVATAINSKSVLSAPSNEILVSIPSARAVKLSQAATLPLCRAGLQPQSQ